MERWRVLLCLVVLALACGCGDEEPAPPSGQTDMFASVDPFIGTGGLGFGVGSTYPGPARPFAMIHPGPDTRISSGAPGFSHCSGYSYGDNLIEGFSLMRMNGTGVPDYGVVAFMPTDGWSEDKRDETGYMTPFSHDDEFAEPGYYRVMLSNGIEVEITSTLRAAAFRFRFPDGVDPVVLIDLEHTLGDGVSGGGTISIDEPSGTLDASMLNLGAMSNRIGGFEVFARAAVTPLPVETGTWADGVDVGGWLRLPAGTHEVELRVATSFVDGDGATANLAAEMPDFDFDGVRAAAAATWHQQLGAVELHGASERDSVIVASALYRSLLMPTLMTDVDNRMRDANDDIVTAGGPRYTDFSLWDTYRTLHPWLLLMEHEANPLFAASLLDFASVGGALPRWAIAHGDGKSMVGSPADIVLAESALKGVDFDEQTAFDLALFTAYNEPPGTMGGRDSIADYVTYGYVPADGNSGSVSRTLEYVAADHALAEWGDALGRTEADDLRQRSRNWRMLYDPAKGFLVPKRKDGSWARFNDPLDQSDAYTEGDAWQYLWLALHDLDGLAETLGGSGAALSKLREFFDQSEAEVAPAGLRLYYWHGNEPDIHAPWIFAAWGQPAESAHWIDWVMRTQYGTGPDGLPGNDDGGTLSAWALFAAAGIYPVAGKNRYIVAAPRQSLMVIKRPSGDLRIETDNHPSTHPVPLRVLLDGVPLQGNELRHDQLVGNHVLRFEMGK